MINLEKIRYGHQNIDREKLVDLLVEDESLREFFIKNDLNTSFIEENLSKLLNFKIENDKCKNCAELKECTQDLTGYEPVIKFLEGKVYSFYRECSYSAFRREKATQESLIDAMYMPKMIYEASLEDYDFSKGKNRPFIHNKLTSFVTLYMNGESVKGLYIFGQYQKGKTYSIAALANELSKRGVKVIIAYYPDLVRELKSRIGNNTLEAMISKLKTIEILMLDDMGGESQSSWVRDEVLGPILQHRLLDERPTFFTSNVSQKELISYMVSNNQKAELMKAARIDARIKSLSEEIEM